MRLSRPSLIGDKQDDTRVINSVFDLIKSSMISTAANTLRFYYETNKLGNLTNYSSYEVYNMALSSLRNLQLIERKFTPDWYDKASFDDLEKYYIQNKGFYGYMIVDCRGKAYMINNQLKIDSIIKEELYYICKSNYPYKLYNYAGMELLGYDIITETNEIPFISTEVKDKNYIVMDYITVTNGLYYIDNLYINGTLKSSYDKKLDKIDLSFIDDSMVGCKVYIIENGTIKNAIITAPYTKDGRGFGIEYED